ncbi:hypothetical protein [Nonomuraea sp. NPDC050310]|uniref:hypothetical protein n=1 Tax=Nonomuraea sp. NPDC050310 TaxID=3154935 RepID=UPI0033C6370D
MAIFISNGDGDDLNEDIGIIIQGNTGPVHLGKGDIIIDSPIVTGKGAIFVKGDSSGISKSFGKKPKKPKKPTK